MNALATLLPNKPSLHMIQRLEAALRDAPQLDVEPVHHFAPGVYLRELTIPADAIVVGKLHRHAHMIMLLSGDVTIYTDEGMKRISGATVWYSSPGTKRVIYAHEESRLLTVHANATNETDMIVLETEIIEPEVNLLQEDAP